MRKTSMNRMLSLLLCIVLIAAAALFASGCVDTSKTDAETVTVKDGDTVGKGSTSFPLTITDGEGKSITVTVNTDKKTVGEALLDAGLIAGEQGDYGLYIQTVNGIRAIYEEDGTYWGFFIDGEYAMTGVDQTDIVSGSTYALVVSQ